MILNAILASPIGKLGIETKQECLVGIHFLPDDAKVVEPSSSVGIEIAKQLKAYFQGRLATFDLPISFLSSLFTQQVLTYLSTIPCGVTKRYSEIAKVLCTSARAVGNACRRNPIPIVIPCHRVTARNNLGGYAGATEGTLLSMKLWLLNHEKNLCLLMLK
jgi:methylated-DNA-[protein]-cysteine S-methyltransferase